MPHPTATSATRNGARARAALAAVLLSMAPLAHAVMLGHADADAVLGQPLHLRIALRTDDGGTIDAACLTVRVDSGDSELPASQLHVALSAGAAGTEELRVDSTRALLEPFAVVTVKLACQYQISRTYTLLVNPPTPERAPQPGQPAPVVVLPQAAAQQAALPPRRQPQMQPGATRAAAREQELAAARLRRERMARERMARERMARERRLRHERYLRAQRALPARAAQRRAPTAPQHAALKLDWLSPAEIGSPALRLSASLGAAPAKVVAAGASAPQAPASAPDIAELGRQLASLRTQIGALDAWRQRQARALALSQSELAQMRNQRDARFAAPTVWLLGLLAAALALLSAYLWRERSRRAPVWYADDNDASPVALAPATPAAAPVVSAPAGAAAAAPAAAAAAMPVVTASAQARKPDPAPAAAPTPAAPAWGQALSLDKEMFSRPLSGKEQVQVDEMMDIGHLADFFIGIGNLDQAIEVMRKALLDHTGGLLALPYLYLFDLYRQTERREDYEALLEQFAHRFNVRIPAWDEAPEAEPRDLESYPRAIALICETWDMPAMVTVIERMLLDDPNKPRVGFDLPAYRDMLDLYAIARDLSRNPHAAPAPEATSAAAPAVPDYLDFALDLGTPSAPAPAELPPLDFTLDPQPKAD